MENQVYQLIDVCCASMLDCVPKCCFCLPKCRAVDECGKPVCTSCSASATTVCYLCCVAYSEYEYYRGWGQLELPWTPKAFVSRHHELFSSTVQIPKVSGRTFECLAQYLMQIRNARLLKMLMY